jgi:hypothetical protein
MAMSDELAGHIAALMVFLCRPVLADAKVRQGSTGNSRCDVCYTHSGIAARCLMPRISFF